MSMRRTGIQAALAAVVITAAACGGSSGSSSSGGSGSISAADLNQMKATIAQYSQPPSFTPPGPPLNAKQLAGKTIFTLPFATNIPFCGDLDNAMKTVAEQFGLKYVSYPNQGQPSQWVAGAQEALSLHPDLFNVFCGINPAQLAPQLDALHAANIPIVSGHNTAEGQPAGPDLAGIVYGQYGFAGKLEADWAITQTNGNANVLVITDVSDPSTIPLVAAIKGEFAKCPSCQVSYSGVAVTDWGTKIGPIVSSTVTSNPGLNYIIPIYDGMVQSVLPALISTNATHRLHIATFNASPSVVADIQQGNVVAADMGEDFQWLARAILDQDFRVLLGMSPAEHDAAGVRLFTAQNASEAGNPPTFDQGYGTAAATGFNQLWGGS